MSRGADVFTCPKCGLDQYYVNNLSGLRMTIEMRPANTHEAIQALTHDRFMLRRVPMLTMVWFEFEDSERLARYLLEGKKVEDLDYQVHALHPHSVRRVAERAARDKRQR